MKSKLGWCIITRTGRLLLGSMSDSQWKAWSKAQYGVLYGYGSRADLTRRGYRCVRVRVEVVK